MRNSKHRKNKRNTFGLDESCKLCDDPIMPETAIKVGNMGPLCRGCYSMFALHFSNLILVKEEPDDSDKEASGEGVDFEYSEITPEDSD